MRYIVVKYILLFDRSQGAGEVDRVNISHHVYELLKDASWPFASGKKPAKNYF
jgi:hypothetical protein